MKKFLLGLFLICALANPAYAAFGDCGFGDCGSGGGGGGGEGTPGGSDTQVQYNNSNAFAGSSNFTYDSVGKTITVNGTNVGGTANKISSSGTYIDLDDGTPGAVRFASYGNVNNGAVDLDCESTAGICNWFSPNGDITQMRWPNNFVTNSIFLGTATPNGAALWSVADDTVSVYHLDDNLASTDVVDEQGNNEGTATANTNTLTVAGKLGRAMTFNGSTTYLDLGSDATLKFAGDFTVAFWFKTTSSGTVKRAVGNRKNDADQTGFDVSVSATGTLILIVKSAGTNVNITGASNKADGAWHFVVAKRTSGVLSMKCDNTSVGSPSGTNADDISGSDNMMIGRTPFLADQFFNGQIDNVVFIDRATTTLEDTSMYNNGNGTTSLASGDSTGAAMNIGGDSIQSASAYHNWGTDLGTTGYGFRDNAGSIEFKNSGGAWTGIGSGSATPGGSDTYVQFNDSNALGGDAGLTYNKTSDTLTVTGGSGGITANGGVNAPAGQEIQSAGNRVNYNLAVYAAGTVYSLTNASAAVDFGTTDPALTLDKAGTYDIAGGVQLKYAAATFAANQTATCKLRRTNNTAADLTGATRTIDLRILTTLTDNAGYIQIPHTYYTTANTDDAVTIYCIVATAPGAGSLDAVSAEITATRMY